MNARASFVRTLSAALALAVLGCGDLPWETAQGGSGTETTGGAKVTGMVVYPDGSAAAGASVSIRAAVWPGDATVAAAADTGEVMRVTADRDGKFRIDTLASGDYLIVAADAKGNLSMADFRNDSERKTQKRAADTLRAAGGLEGSLVPIRGLPDTGEVAVFGLGRRVRADSAGRFRIEGLPSGRVRLRARSARPFWKYPDTEVAVAPASTVSLVPFTALPDEDYSTWPQTRKVSVEISLADIKETVRDFPLCVRMTKGMLDIVGDGSDVRFSDARGKPLAYAIQVWSPKDEYAMAWVHLDSVRPADTTIRIHWGKAGAPDRSDPAAVFASFAGVWPLQDSIPANGQGSFKDFSPAGVPAVGQTAPGSGTSLFPGGKRFRSADGLTASAGSRLKPTGGLYFSAWIKIDAADTVRTGLASMAGNYGMNVGPGGRVRFYLEMVPNGGISYYDLENSDSAGLADGQWHLVTGTYDGTTMRAFRDGHEFMSTSPGKTLAYPKAGDFRMGEGFSGDLSGIMVGGQARAPAWIKVQFENQRPNSAMVGFIQ